MKDHQVAFHQKWRFWIDRGGTFTDIVAIDPTGTVIVHKLLSTCSQLYSDAPLHGIRSILKLHPHQPIPVEQIAEVRMGTTVATNGLLERKGDSTVLLITKGFGDALRIGYQNRPHIFARQIQRPELLYEEVIEVAERYSAQGEELQPITEAEIQRITTALQLAHGKGIRTCAIVLMHGYRYPAHEEQIATLARLVGFRQVSVSHQVSPLIKLVSRGDTTIVDAYLSPILRNYIDGLVEELTGTEEDGSQGNNKNKVGWKYRSTSSYPTLRFMQSNGGLIDAHCFQGKDSILSGPAGGIVGAVETCKKAGFHKIISFDMGGTSTDVAHYQGEYERQLETEIAGVRLRTPMMAIHTVAAGGGSIVQFDGDRYRVGPSSAGAYPGPACYGHGGPLTITDCNLVLGRIQPEFFPSLFGTHGDQPLDRQIVEQKFHDLREDIFNTTGNYPTLEEVAEGYLTIAVEKMANAIRKISIQRGYNPSEYTLCCFGGAGGQHACRIAASIGIPQVFIHPYAGVLSAYGMGLAQLRVLRQQTIDLLLTEGGMEELDQLVGKLAEQAMEEFHQQGIDDLPFNPQLSCKAYVRYQGTDSTLMVDWGSREEMEMEFEQLHHLHYGFQMPGLPLVVDTLSVEVVEQRGDDWTILPPPISPTAPLSASYPVYFSGQWHTVPVYERPTLPPGTTITAPALIIEATGTNVLEPGWVAKISEDGNLLFQQWTDCPPPVTTHPPIPTAVDPLFLEIFSNLFMAIAEQMGVTLQNTSTSVNIKERLDYSCALFDQDGNLVANAPHIPVHLGSMGTSVQCLIAAHGCTLQPGDVYVSNNPYHGGTHLPDITVITPIFQSEVGSQPHPLFFVASRGHHADIGGVTPGSMPPHSMTVEQEGVLLDNLKLVEQGHFLEHNIRQILTQGPYPARNPNQTIADLKAQIAANEKGVQELGRIIGQYGLIPIQNYMQYVQDQGEVAVRRVIARLAKTIHSPCQFTYPLDNGSQIQVNITFDQTTTRAIIDFTGTSPQQSSNFNAPFAVCQAAVLYVFRTLVEEDIPLNAGCLKPIELFVPDGSMLKPRFPSAVVAGNVEVSQGIVDALYGALGIMAASQGTMNNLTFGNHRYQYYETLGGGSGAGADFNGTDAVHTHMTNSRLTDPEVLESRFPVFVDSFHIRANSGGKGAYSGGNGVLRRLRFRETMDVAILSSRRLTAPFGLKGGAPGAMGQNWIERNDGTIEVLPGLGKMKMHPGDAIVIATPGGGGYGMNKAGL